MGRPIHKGMYGRHPRFSQRHTLTPGTWASEIYTSVVAMLPSKGL
jgi:hypothetical protein